MLRCVLPRPEDHRVTAHRGRALRAQLCRPLAPARRRGALEGYACRWIGSPAGSSRDVVGEGGGRARLNRSRDTVRPPSGWMADSSALCGSLDGRG
jgi:hypothetical protein